MRHEHAVIDFSSPAVQERMKLPEGKISEIINGVLYVWPSSPNFIHTKLAFGILMDLALHVKPNNLGEVYFAPLDVYLDAARTILVPDISFTSYQNDRVVFDEHGIIGPPDLIVEVLSPSTKRRDLTVKKRAYEVAGVREYWIVDPETQDCAGYLLHNNRYDEPLMTHLKIHIRILNKTVNISPLIFPYSL